MLNSVSTSIILITISSLASAKPQILPSTPAIPSYVVLPEIPNNMPPPPPGQPSSFSISQIRNRRASANSTSNKSPSASFSSSASSSEENPPKFNKKEPSGPTTNTTASHKPQPHNEPKQTSSGYAKIEAFSAPLPQLDLPAMIPPVTHRMVLNESHAEAMMVVTTPGTSTVAVSTTLGSLNDEKNTTIGSTH